MGLLLHLFWFLIIGLAAGWLAGQIMHGQGFGLGRNLVIGVLGAVLGGFLLPILGFRTTYILGELLSATIGAILFLFWMRKMGRQL